MRVLLHGFAGRADDFDCPSNLPFSREWKNLLGSKTFIPELTTDPHYQGCDLWELARRLLIEIKKHKGPHTLWGYSMGARIAWHMLLLEPDYFESAVMVSGQIGLKDAAEKKQRKEWELGWAQKWLAADWNKTWSEWKNLEVFGEILSNDWGPSRGELRWLDFDKKLVQKSLAEALTLRALGSQDYLLPRLNTIKTRVLLVTGQNDSKYLQLLPPILESHKKFKSVVIANCGHRVMWDNASEFIKAIQLFEGKT